MGADTTNGFRAYSKRLLSDPGVALSRMIHAFRLHNYQAIRASRLDFPVPAVPVTRAYPSGIPGMTKTRSFRGNASVPGQFLRAHRQRFNLSSPPWSAGGGCHG